tara:strand:+ start:3733 stop:4044 length:312 start_codon:yes stop_codon:yes gene_type:complete
VDWQSIPELPSTVEPHPVTDLGWKVYFESPTNHSKVFQSLKVPAPLNRFLGYGKSMYVEGISLEALQRLCCVGRTEAIVPLQVDSDTGSDISSDQEEDDEEDL